MPPYAGVVHFPEYDLQLSGINVYNVEILARINIYKITFLLIKITHLIKFVNSFSVSLLLQCGYGGNFIDIHIVVILHLTLQMVIVGSGDQ